MHIDARKSLASSSQPLYLLFLVFRSGFLTMMTMMTMMTVDDTTSEFQSHIPRHPLRIICLLPTALPSLEMQTIESINSEGLCFGGVAK